LVTSAETEAQILRFHHVEKWPVGTIAKQVGVHHSVVRRVLAQAGTPAPAVMPRPSRIDPFLPLIRQTLGQYPTLRSSRLYEMARERGYQGSADHFRHMVARHRPRRPAEAYLRLRTLPGEQAQVDWGHFGHLQVGRARRPLMAFVMVLSHSRQVFLRFFLDARMENFLRGHAGAFAAWQGVPRVILYDNLRSAVLERQGEAIRFNPELLRFAALHRYEPRPVAVARGNEKGRVERAIRYIRENFFAARSYRDVDDLNAQAEAWCHGPAAERRCPDDPARSVAEAFAEEARLLLPLPEAPPPLFERAVVRIGKTPYARFDGNDYSVPHVLVGRSLVVHADLGEVRLCDGPAVVARHPRSFDKGAQIEDPAHIAALVAQKQAARQHRATDRLAQAVPASADLLRLAAARGDNIGAITAGLLRLLETHSAAELQEAVLEAVSRSVPHPNAVRLALDRRREASGAPPPTALVLPEHVTARDVPVRQHRLETYDCLTRDDGDE